MRYSLVLLLTILAIIKTSTIIGQSLSVSNLHSIVKKDAAERQIFLLEKGFKEERVKTEGLKGASNISYSKGHREKFEQVIFQDLENVKTVRYNFGSVATYSKYHRIIKESSKWSFDSEKDHHSIRIFKYINRDISSEIEFSIINVSDLNLYQIAFHNY